MQLVGTLMLKLEVIFFLIDYSFFKCKKITETWNKNG